MSEASSVPVRAPHTTIVASGPGDDQAPFFDATAAGARAAAEYAAAAINGTRIPWAADRVALAAYLQALWLIGNNHPAGPLALLVTFDPQARAVQVQLGDGGRVLSEEGEPGPLLTALLGYITGKPWAVHTATGRALASRIPVRSPFRVRETWHALRYGTPARHAQQDIAEFDTREEADAAARRAMAALATREDGWELAEVHTQGPDDGEAWRCAVRLAGPGPDGTPRRVAEDLAMDPVDLVEVLRQAAVACTWNWKERGQVPPRDLAGLLEYVFDPVDPLEAELRQVAAAAAAAAPAPENGPRVIEGPGITDPLVSLVASSHADALGVLEHLRHRLHQARLDREADLMLTRADQRRGPAGLAAQLTLSGCYHLIARDPGSGEVLVARDLYDLGMGAAVLAEDVLAGRVSIDEGTGRLAVTESTEIRGLSATAYDLLATIEATPSLPVGRWLEFLARTADAPTAAALLEAKFLVAAGEAGRRRAGEVPVREIAAQVIDWASARGDDPDRARRDQDVALLLLVRATGLHELDRRWWKALDVPLDPTFLEERPDLARLLTFFADALTAKVAAGRW